MEYMRSESCAQPRMVRSRSLGDLSHHHHTATGVQQFNPSDRRIPKPESSSTENTSTISQSWSLKYSIPDFTPQPENRMMEQARQQWLGVILSEENREKLSSSVPETGPTFSQIAWEILYPSLFADFLGLTYSAYQSLCDENSSIYVLKNQIIRAWRGGQEHSYRSLMIGLLRCGEANALRKTADLLGLNMHVAPCTCTSVYSRTLNCTEVSQPVNLYSMPFADSPEGVKDASLATPDVHPASPQHLPGEGKTTEPRTLEKTAALDDTSVPEDTSWQINPVLQYTLREEHLVELVEYFELFEDFEPSECLHNVLYKILGVKSWTLPLIHHSAPEQKLAERVLREWVRQEGSYAQLLARFTSAKQNDLVKKIKLWIQQEQITDDDDID